HPVTARAPVLTRPVLVSPVLVSRDPPLPVAQRLGRVDRVPPALRRRLVGRRVQDHARSRGAQRPRGLGEVPADAPAPPGPPHPVAAPPRPAAAPAEKAAPPAPPYRHALRCVSSRSPAGP